MEELTDAAKGLAFTEDLEKTSEERVDMLYKFIEVIDVNCSILLKHDDAVL